MEKSVESNENTENTLIEQKLEKNKKVIKKSSEIKGIKKYNKSGDLIYNIDMSRHSWCSHLCWQGWTSRHSYSTPGLSACSFCR